MEKGFDLERLAEGISLQISSIVSKSVSLAISDAYTKIDLVKAEFEKKHDQLSSMFSNGVKELNELIAAHNEISSKRISDESEKLSSLIKSNYDDVCSKIDVGISGIKSSISEGIASSKEAISEIEGYKELVGKMILSFDERLSSEVESLRFGAADSDRKNALLFDEIKESLEKSVSEILNDFDCNKKLVSDVVIKLSSEIEEHSQKTEESLNSRDVYIKAMLDRVLSSENEIGSIKSSIDTVHSEIKSLENSTNEKIDQVEGRLLKSVNDNISSIKSEIDDKIIEEAKKAAIKGDKGDPGPKGDTGDVGPKGDKGCDGLDAIEIKSVEIDHDKEYGYGVFGTFNNGLFKSVVPKTMSLSSVNGNILEAGWKCLVNGLSNIEVHHIGDGDVVVKTILSNGSSNLYKVSIPALVYKGVFQQSQKEFYRAGNILTHKGSSWHCNVDRPTTAPGESQQWQLMAKKGADGKPGN